MNQATLWGTLATSLALASMLAGCGNDSSDTQPQESHYFKVKLHQNGKIASIHQFRISDDKEVVTAYPYGRTFAAQANSGIQQLSQGEFEEFMRPHVAKSARSTAQATTTSDALMIGYNPSTGATFGQCYNFGTEQPPSPDQQTTFSLDNAASSAAAQTNITASVSGAYAGFKASDKFSYSDQFQSSTNSGTAYSKGWILYPLNIYLDKTNPLTTQGLNTNAGQFSQICGTQYMTTVQAGMLVIGTVAWHSDSSSASQSISDSLTASYGNSFNLKATATAAQTVKKANWGIDVSLEVDGGGTAASQIITNAQLALADALADCGANKDTSPDSCDTYSTGMNAAIKSALQAFEAIASSSDWLQNINTFSLFPYNVAGSTLVTLNTENAPGPTLPDTLQPYQTELTNYLALLNQIATLNNRASHLSTAVGQDDFNWESPDTYINLQETLTTLSGTYTVDVEKMVKNLGQCLSATTGDVNADCAPIINNTIQDAYTWYGSNEGNQNWPAQQNTIALQYVGTFNTTYTTNISLPSGGQQLPTDVVYIDELPDLAGTAAANISKQSALAAFADAQYTWGNTTATNQSGALLPLPTMTDIEDIVEVNSTPKGGFYGVYDTTWFNAGSPIIWRTSCKPTFAQPCELYYQAQDSGINWLDITPISFFFK